MPIEYLVLTPMMLVACHFSWSSKCPISTFYYRVMMSSIPATILTSQCIKKSTSHYTMLD